MKKRIIAVIALSLILALAIVFAGATLAGSIGGGQVIDRRITDIESKAYEYKTLPKRQRRLIRRTRSFRELIKQTENSCVLLII